MKELEMKVDGMSCGGCEKRIEKVVKDISGVDKVEADYKKGTVKVKGSDSVDKRDVQRKIEDIGYKVKG